MWFRDGLAAFESVLEPRPLPEADAAIPAGPGDVTRPTAIDPDDTLAPAVATATETLFDHSLDLTFETDGLFG